VAAAVIETPKTQCMAPGNFNLELMASDFMRMRFWYVVCESGSVSIKPKINSNGYYPGNGS
jgi:hypothetical protein